MKEMIPLPALLPQDAAEALRRRNDITARFGLTLTPAQCARLAACHAEVLRETGRVEVGESALPRLAEALCDSPYLAPETWETTLAEMTALFYRFKGLCRERLSDDELLAVMCGYFNGTAHGCTELLASLDAPTLLRLARAERGGGHA